NTLRRDGAITPGPYGWRWRAPVVRRYTTGGDVLDLITARIEALPAAARALIDAMSCLGDSAETVLLAAAVFDTDRLDTDQLDADQLETDQLDADRRAGELLDAIAPALEDGLLILD